MNILKQYLILPLITACIVTISVIIFYHLDKPEDAKNLTASPRGNSTSQKPAAHTTKETSQNPQIAASRRDFVYPVDNARDPFQQVPDQVDTPHLPASAVDKSSIMLTGIIWDVENPIAIVANSDNNSYLIRTGEEISEVKIIAIRQSGITIERDGETQELVLLPEKAVGMTYSHP